MNAVSAPDRVDHGTKRILIVDDDRTVCEILVEFFKAFKHGHAYDLATARDGNEAMGALRQEKFDLVMLDMGMPRMSGLDVLTHMRRDAIRVPVLMLTGNKNTHAAAEALRSGVFAYIPKPVDLLHLDHLVALAQDGDLTLSDLNADPGHGAVAVICAGGYRSSIAASLLERIGVSRVSNVVGGMAAWSAAGLPVVA